MQSKTANNNEKEIKVSSEILEEIFVSMLERQKLDKISSDYLKLHDPIVNSKEWQEYVKLRDAIIPHYELFQLKYNDILEATFGVNYQLANVYNFLFEDYAEKYFHLGMIDKKDLNIEGKKIIYAGLQGKLEFNS